MAMTGWYPDPGGMPGRYRYWDGESWSEATTDDPADPPPGTGGPLPPREDSHHPGRAVGIAALVLVVVVVSVVLIMRRTDDVGSLDLDPASAPSTSGWQSAGTATGSSTAPSAPRTADGSSATAGTCPAGQPADLALHPQDGRIHGGRLSMAPVPGYSDPEPEYMLSWMWDTQGVNQTTEPGWQSIFAVGEVRRTAGFSTTEEAAHSSLGCAIRTDWYLNYTGRKDIRDAAITVDGHPGWIVTAEIHDDTPQIRVAGDQLTFVVVDDGRQDAFSVWCGMVPLGDQQRLALDQKVLSGLKVGG
ncbi:DUF2510 domain-containing protein [Microlunatus elymi]|uniref:DUF2510 domain-containing protein n=1 Tax=Microlunatus elymi TaxID=2596828 RepID=A0A516Q2Y1_9ACTN|nr:DUF2510 domain-containing protein [Microlunatus elymi]QDP97783.1 DUF2510 domain-containing protein [Microlunatus elymi]